MALSGSLSTAYSGWTYRVDWVATQSVANNNSTVTCRHYLVCKSGFDLYIGTRENACSVGGDTKAFTSPKISTAGNTTIMLGQTVHTVAHNADGTKSVALNSNFNVKATLAGTYKETVLVTGIITLDTIPRASQPSCVTWPEHTQNVGEFGDTISIHMNRNSSSFTHTVRYAYGKLTGTIATGVGTGTTWTIPLSFMDLIPNATSGSGTIYVDTYNGSTLIGTKSCGFTATVPSTVKPTCSLQVLDATGCKDTYGNLVRGLSKLYVKVTPSLAYSSPIDSYNVVANGTKYTAAESTTGVLTAAGTTTVTATVTDERGRTSAQASASFPVIDYNKPAITSLSVHRCNEDGTENDKGEYCKITFSARIYALNNKNSAAYTLQWKKTSETNYPEGQSYTFTALAGKYTVSDASYVFPADSDYSYDVQITATDDIDSVSRSTPVSTASTFMDWDVDNDGISFGEVSEEAETFKNAWSLHQKGNRYAFQPGAFNGAKGYTALATIKLTDSAVVAPIVFVINRDDAICPMKVHVTFRRYPIIDAPLSNIKYEGENFGAFMVKVGTATWTLYVDNTAALPGNPCLQDWYTTEAQKAKIVVSFPNEQVETLPTPYYRATPVVLRSILDCFMPVGYVLILYSHADPNTMYPDTTWERIQNAFLWACDENGDIGTTGGEKTHTLTVAELPSHTHGSVYSGNVSGTKTHAWLASGGSNMAYGTVAAGGGVAHNNMPPYIQVSVWRRTA